MSEQMDRAVLTMPYELAMGDELSRMQFWSRVQLVYKEQCARIEADEALMRQALEAVKQLVEEKADYMIRNKLGNPYVEHTTKQGTAAITALRTRLEQAK